MTSQTLSPHDTGEIRRPDSDEPTRNLSGYAVKHPTASRRPSTDETAVITLIESPAFPTGAELAVAARLTDGRDIPPPPYPVPVPPPPSDLERIMRSGEYPTLRPASPLGEYGRKRSVPYVRPEGLPRAGRGRHRRPSLLARLLGGGR